MTDTLTEVRDYLAHLDAGRRNTDNWLRELLAIIGQHSTEASEMLDRIVSLSDENERLAQEVMRASPHPTLTPESFKRMGGQA